MSSSLTRGALGTGIRSPHVRQIPRWPAAASGTPRIGALQTGQKKLMAMRLLRKSDLGQLPDYRRLGAIRMPIESFLFLIVRRMSSQVHAPLALASGGIAFWKDCAGQHILRLFIRIGDRRDLVGRTVNKRRRFVSGSNSVTDPIREEQLAGIAMAQRRLLLSSVLNTFSPIAARCCRTVFYVVLLSTTSVDDRDSCRCVCGNDDGIGGHG